MERWEVIDWTNGEYLISDDGQIKSLKRGKERLMKLQKDRRGYPQTRLFVDGKLHHVSVHREVARAFIPNPLNLATVNHKDGSHDNNNVDNLEWMSNFDNIEHGQAKQFIVTDPQGEEFHIFNLSKFCRENWLNNGSMYAVINGKIKHHKQWRIRHV